MKSLSNVLLATVLSSICKQNLDFTASKEGDDIKVICGPDGGECIIEVVPGGLEISGTPKSEPIVDKINEDIKKILGFCATKKTECKTEQEPAAAAEQE